MTYYQVGTLLITMIMIRRVDGHDQEFIHQRHSAGWMVWRENMRGKTEMVWTRSEER